MENRLFNTLAIQSAFGAGSHTAIKTYNLIISENALDKSFDELAFSDFLDDKVQKRLQSLNKTALKEILTISKKYEIDIIPIYSDKYPQPFRNIYLPPLAIFVKGILPDVTKEPAFCIVGPRKITDFGKKAAYSLARRLAKSGMIIVSGSAKGADTFAHSGVINANGKSIMIIADGIVTELNSGNSTLCKNVLLNGCIISEAPPFAKALKYSFPIRNRLMSALSLGVAVIEAPEKSGALITANHAIEQGKDVFVIPGSPVSNAYKGSNALLRDGAIPLLNTSDIFLRYIADYPDKINIEKAYADNKAKQKTPHNNLSKEAIMLYNNIVKPEFTVDDFSGIGMDATSLLSSLTELEMEHLIISQPGGSYKLIDKREF